MRTVLSASRSLVLLAACAAFLAACASLGPGGPARPSDRVAPPAAAGFQDAIADVAAAALPCVVHIEVTGSTLRPGPPSGAHAPGSPPTADRVPMRALGSGILISADGHVLTNNHVVQNADSITVQFQDGTESPARLVGSDRYTDIAVIQVQQTGAARTARLGDSDSLRVGEWVVAIGSPRGLDWTVTAGIVSATHRANMGRAPEGLEDFIQTDAPINPGNSGGPLLNLRGEVVGMNSMIISQSQGSEGLGFAIPANLVRTISQTLIRDGKVTRGDLGISAQDLTDSIRKALKAPDATRGVVVAEALPLGPAAEAGMTAGDIVTSFQGTAVESAAQFNRLVAAAAPGSSVTLAVIRDGAALSVSLKVSDQADLQTRQAARPGYALLGIRVEPVSDSLAQSIGMKSPAGVVVMEVVPGSPADSVNVGTGDIILQVGGAAVNTQEQFRQNVRQAIEAGSVVVLIRDAQSGRTGYLEIPLP